MNNLKRRLRSEAGFSLTEMMVVVGILGTLSAFASIQISLARSSARGDAAMRVVLYQMNQAREMAIGQRRYIELTFDTTNNTMSIVREDTTSTTTTIRTIGFEGGARFGVMSGISDTPDAFGKTTSTSFSSTNGTFASLSGTTTLVKFAPDGTLVDYNGRLANGTVFLLINSGGNNSYRAVTVLGSTGRVRGYRYDGSNWKVV